MKIIKPIKYVNGSGRIVNITSNDVNILPHEIVSINTNDDCGNPLITNFWSQLIVIRYT